MEKNVRYLRFGLGAALTAVLVAACGGGGAPDSAQGGSDKIQVFVSIAPQACLVERVGGDRVEVEVLVQPGQSPATYDLTPNQRVRLAKADVYFHVGLPFEEPLIPKIRGSMPQLRIVDTRDGVGLLDMEEHEHEGQAEYAHEHAAKDPHIWLDPLRLDIQARNIANELSKIAPQYQDEFIENRANLKADLDALNEKIVRMTEPVRGRTMYVFHPAYGYFAERYGLRQVAVERGGHEPGARELDELAEAMKAEGARAIFVQRQFSTRQAETIAQAVGAEVIVLDPLARDILTGLEEMAASIVRGLGGGER
jgi:zinc transport system substrate-binding protein